MLGQDGGFECLLLLLLLQLWCFVVGIGWVVSWVQCDCCRDSERVQIESPKIRISAKFVFGGESFVCKQLLERGEGQTRHTSGDGDYDEDEYHGLVVVDSERQWK